MEYFRLEQDRRIPYSVLMQGLPRVPNIRNAMQGDVISLKNMTVVMVSPGKLNRYPNILDRQLFLVKEPIKTVFNIFDPALQYRYFCLLDIKNDVYEYYFAPALELIDCLDESSSCNLDKSIVSKVIIKQETIEGKEIFRVKNVKDCVIIVSLSVAESILRRRIEGIRLQPILLTS